MKIGYIKLLIIFGVVSLAACGGSFSSSSGAPGAGAGGGAVTATGVFSDSLVAGLRFRATVQSSGQYANELLVRNPSSQAAPQG